MKCYSAKGSFSIMYPSSSLFVFFCYIFWELLQASVKIQIMQNQKKKRDKYDDNNEKREDKERTKNIDDLGKR